MREENIKASDPSYHNRHEQRSLQRARCIAKHIKPGGTILDIGCNKGITSDFLLKGGFAERTTGVELFSSTVDPSLLADPKFKLIEGNIANIRLKKRYDVCIYGAVHHHILSNLGLSAAVETLQKLAAQSNRQVFFETGQISEGGRWEWQRAIRQHFRTDEEHFFYMLRSIEDLIDDFFVIGRFRIHAAWRSYFCIKLKPPANREVPGSRGTIVPLSGQIEKSYARSRGSKKQRLIRANSAEATESPTTFSVALGSNGNRLFIKSYRHHPHSAVTEWQIGRQIGKSWATQALGLGEARGAIVFDYIDSAEAVMSFGTIGKLQRSKIAKQVLSVFKEARRIPISLPPSVLLPTPSNTYLLELCDLNPNNILVVVDADEPLVRVVDFEQQGVHYKYRNRIHLARILWSLRQFRLRAVWELMSGVTVGAIHLIRFQTKPLTSRIKHRQPSLISLVIADFRSGIGRVLQAAIRLATRN